jgi:hypothetical protein
LRYHRAMQHLRAIHLGLGILGIVAFVLTGQYMGIFLAGLEGMPDGPRLLYRTSHLYLMWSSLLNLTVGYYFAPASGRNAKWVQAFSSALLLLGPPLILTGFFIESPANDLDRVFSSWANYFALGGVILHIVATASGRKAEAA